MYELSHDVTTLKWHTQLIATSACVDAMRSVCHLIAYHFRLKQLSNVFRTFSRETNTHISLALKDGEL